MVLGIVDLGDDVDASDIKFGIGFDFVPDDVLYVYEICEHAGVDLVFGNEVIGQDKDADVFIVEFKEFVD